jgi:KUP system potassium uptake protein
VTKEAEPRSDRRLLYMALTALGVVFGDIGTSPLYVLKVCFDESHRIAVTPENVLGILSLIFWALVLVIGTKYLTLMMRADNRGEGGVLALMVLARKPLQNSRRAFWVVTAFGIFGAALLYGDGVITPAISVLSAVEGLEIAAPGLDSAVVPITVLLLVGLFVLQHRGTGGVGMLFGPIMLVWFSVLALLGVSGIARNPSVLAAVNPLHAARFFHDQGITGFLVLGAVFLAVTGGEALYADMGHFGKGPIRLTWFAFVFPALLLNYFGQGALLLRSPDTLANPFFRLAPSWAVMPLVVLATAATIIASQAVITGSFSLTRQAIQLGFCPRLTVRHTSEAERGQIYLPTVNWALMAATLLLVVAFRSSDNLAAAYGMAVTTDMLLASAMLLLTVRGVWKWPLWGVVPLFLFFFAVDLGFWSANLVKIPNGGWFPLLLAAVIFVLMTTWKRGRSLLYERLRTESIPLELFLRDLHLATRVAGTGIYMTGSPTGAPVPLLHTLKHFHVVHEKVVLLTVLSDEERPVVRKEKRLEVEDLGQGVYRLVARYGFMESPDVPSLLKEAARVGLHFEPMKTSFILGRETLISTSRPGMARWREHLFAWMSRNAQGAMTFFGLPPNRVVELGVQVEL